MNQKKYKLEKKTENITISSIDSDKFKGFTVTPQNNVEYPGIEVNSMMVIKNSFIEKLLKKKIKRKLDYYLQYIIMIIESDDESADDSALRQALDDLTRYKDIIEYKYRKYLDDKYINILLKKISLIEGELKSKIIYKSFNYYAVNQMDPMENTNERGKSR